AGRNRDTQTSGANGRQRWPPPPGQDPSSSLRYVSSHSRPLRPGTQGSYTGTGRVENDRLTRRPPGPEGPGNNRDREGGGPGLVRPSVSGRYRHLRGPASIPQGNQPCLGKRPRGEVE